MPNKDEDDNHDEYYYDDNDYYYDDSDYDDDDDVFLSKDQSVMMVVGNKADPGSYTFIFTPKNRPTVLALSVTTCKHVAVSPETAMGCRRIRFLQAEEGYYCTFSLNNNYLYKIELRHALI